MAIYRCPSSSSFAEPSSDAPSTSSNITKPSSPVLGSNPIPGAAHVLYTLKLREKYAQAQAQAVQAARYNNNNNNNNNPFSPKKHGKKRSTADSNKKKGKVENAIERERMKVKSLEATYHIFVGNLPSTMTEDSLRRAFAPCGTIADVNIRCSQGVAAPLPEQSRGRSGTPQIRDRRYAVIEFRKVTSVAVALRMNGQRIGDTRVAVCRTAGELPEVDDIVRRRLDDICGLEPMSRGPKQPRQLVREATMESTFIFDPANPGRAKREWPWEKFNIFGWSFTKTLI